MPELPEVETSRLGILPHLKGGTIEKVIVRQSKLRWEVDVNICCAQGQKIIDIKRRAKYLLLQLTSDWIVIHLGMSGRLRILTHWIEADKHDHIDLILTNGITLRYTDPRRFGSWLWTKKPETLPQICHLGPEPLSEDFSPDYLFKLAKKSKMPIKNWIMSNHIVVGVGNIYASESLFMAKIDPNRAVSALSLSDFKRLSQAIKQVLVKSIEQGGTTLKDFLQSDGKPGYFVQELQVYGRVGKPCRICSNLIESKKIGQRNTFYCPNCQK